MAIHCAAAECGVLIKIEKERKKEKKGLPTNVRRPNQQIVDASSTDAFRAKGLPVSIV